MLGSRQGPFLTDRSPHHLAARLHIKAALGNAPLISTIKERKGEGARERQRRRRGFEARVKEAGGGGGRMSDKAVAVVTGLQRESWGDG